MLRLRCTSVSVQRWPSVRCSSAPRRPVATLPSKADAEMAYFTFYRYLPLENLPDLRTQLLEEWGRRRALGRIYLASEGINAQMTAPLSEADELVRDAQKRFRLRFAPVLERLQQHLKPFRKLQIKIRRQIVADNLPAGAALDLERTGEGLAPADWHRILTERRPAALVDCRNFYEAEIGHFEGALPLPVHTFAESFDALDRCLADRKPDDEIMIYCTGGIRCEKVGAYLTQRRGFTNVKRLEGGINAYAAHVRAAGLRSAFVGRNFVFDGRTTAPVVPGPPVSRCHACGAACDEVVNCRHAACNVLVVQCPACALRLDGTCGPACQEAVQQGRKQTVPSSTKRRAFRLLLPAAPLGHGAGPTRVHTRGGAAQSDG